MTNSTQKPVDWTKPVQFRRGVECTVLTTTCPGTYPVVVMDKDGTLYKYSIDGTGYDGEDDDIINKPEECILYINLYNCGIGDSYENISDATNESIVDRIAILKLTFVEGVPVKSEIIPV